MCKKQSPRYPNRNGNRPNLFTNTLIRSTGTSERGGKTPKPRQMHSTAPHRASHLVIPFVVKGVLLEAAGRLEVHGLAHVYQERFPQVGLVGALRGKGVLNPRVRPRHVEPGAPADLNLGPVVVRQLVPDVLSGGERGVGRGGGVYSLSRMTVVV